MSPSKSSIDLTGNDMGGAATVASSLYLTGRPLKMKFCQRLFTSMKDQEHFVKEWTDVTTEVLSLLRKTGRTFYIVPNRDTLLYEKVKEEILNERIEKGKGG